MVRIVAGALAALLFALGPGHAQTPPRPMTGGQRPIPVPVQQAPGASSLIEINVPGTPQTRVRTALALWLPADAVQRKGDGYELALGDKQFLIVDPDKGEWYRFLDYRESTHAYFLEGDKSLLLTSAECGKPQDRFAYLGSNEPKLLLDESDPTTREVIFVEQCVPYRAVVECSGATANAKCVEAQTRLAGSDPRRKLVRVDILRLSVRQPGQGLHTAYPSTPRIVAATKRENAPLPFQFVEPGHVHVRQYEPPAKCGDVAVGQEFAIKRETPYSRLIFAGPELIKRFPIANAANEDSTTNSQIFGPGGEFFVWRNGKSQTVSKLKEQCGGKPPAVDGKWGALHAQGKKNFEPPWSDTFCEARGGKYTQPFCTPAGGVAAQNQHFGLDIRGSSADIKKKEPVVSVSDGVVVEVGGEGNARGNNVKIRSQHLIFVYRHMDPADSPFKDGGGTLRLGSRVAAGQFIGHVSNWYPPSGTTKHLHFEIEAPLPRALLFGPQCIKTAGDRKVRICSAREKAPPYPSMIVAYLRERYGETLPITQKDATTGLDVLPRHSRFEIPAKDIGKDAGKADPARPVSVLRR